MSRRDDNRAAFPGTAEAIDSLRAIFGPGVKLLHATENSREIGKPQPFDGTDIAQFIRLDDAMKQRGTV